jgi:hypothetical protein
MWGVFCDVIDLFLVTWNKRFGGMIGGFSWSLLQVTCNLEKNSGPGLMFLVTWNHVKKIFKNMVKRHPKPYNR